jgi:hypothetical protein
MRPATSTIAQARLREIVDSETLAKFPITAEELGRTVVVVRSSALASTDGDACVQQICPWMSPWTAHDKWLGGRWTCEISDRTNYYSTGELLRFLAFHTDMSRYAEPPEFVTIRCVRPDPAGPSFGRNYFLHIDDVRERLQRTGRDDIMAVLQRPRVLRSHSGDVDGVMMLPPAGSSEPARIYDAAAATTGEHLILEQGDRAVLSEFLILCRSWADLQIDVALGENDWAVVSNHRWVHARGECQSVGRVTEVYWGVRIKCRGESAPVGAALRESSGESEGTCSSSGHLD